MSWCAGCWAGDDYDLAVQEVLDTQALNRRTGKEKTYHLLVSFHPEDEGKLTPDVFRQIEERFADALGLSEHQRHCGVHVNTENIHMHVAYTLIHPEKLTRVEPWRDYLKRDKLCRELEKEYGLTVDNGREAGKERGLDSRAAAMEAHSGRQSFEGFARQESALSWLVWSNVNPGRMFTRPLRPTGWNCGDVVPGWSSRIAMGGRRPKPAQRTVNFP